MKTTILVLVAAMCIAGAQTNAPTKTNLPGAKPTAPTLEQIYAGLATISNKLEQVEAASRKLADQESAENNKLNLERAAGRINEKQFSEQLTKIQQKYPPLFERLDKARAELKLQELNIRARYGIPEPSKKKRRVP